MALTDFDYIATRNEIIEGAMRIVGALEIGQPLSADLLDQGVRALQQLVKSWSNEHLFLWSLDALTFNTVADQTDYAASLYAPLIGVEKAFVVEDNDDIELEVVSWSRYQDIVDKEENTGRPRLVAYKPTPAPSLYFWPTPDAIYEIKTLCIVPLQDFDDADGTGNIPVRFQRALKYGLAEDLFDEYPGPMNERQFIKQKAFELFMKAKNTDMPVETTNEVEGLFR